MLSSDRDMSRKCRILLNLLFLLFFAIFVAQSFHIAIKILVTFAIFAKFAISSILLIAVFFTSFLLKLRIELVSKFLLTRSILDIGDLLEI